jgi:predicted Holliday junction resolvase-like endonuclease
MPDLFLWKDDQILLVEVKSENDKLSEQQISWIQEFNHVSLSYEICHISSKIGEPI